MPKPYPAPQPDQLITYGRSRAVRHPHYSYADDAEIHLTICAARGAPFSSPALAKLVCDSIEFYSNKLAYRLYGYCLMPDHLHVLLSPADSGVSVGQWLKAFKGFTGRKFVALSGRRPLWQRSAHDHVCRKGETAEAVLRYIAENPLRSGLVEKWEDWPWTKLLIEV